MRDFGIFESEDKIISGKPDIFIRDALDDDGTEPYTGITWWDSPDIWILDENGNLIASPFGRVDDALPLSEAGLATLQNQQDWLLQPRA